MKSKIGMSASKMKQYAKVTKSFEKGLLRGVNADALMKKVRKGMNLSSNYLHMRNLNDCKFRRI